MTIEVKEQDLQVKRKKHQIVENLNYLMMIKAIKLVVLDILIKIKNLVN